MSPAHEHSRRGSGTGDVTDLSDEDRREHRPDPGDPLYRGVAGITFEPPVDPGVALDDLAVVALDQTTQRLDPIDVGAAEAQLIQPACPPECQIDLVSEITPSLPEV